MMASPKISSLFADFCLLQNLNRLEDRMHKKDVQLRVVAQVRKDLERGRDEIAKPIFGRLTQWIKTAAWWKLMLLYVATWPVGVAESFVMHELIGFFPGLGTLIDGVLLHAINEFIFLTLPIILLLELWRRLFWKIRGWLTPNR
jgi:hypothetical protein